MKKVFTLLLFFITTPLFSQQLTVLTTDTSAYPTIKAKIFLLDKNGQSKTLQNRNDIEVIENGSQRQVLSLTCTPAPPPTDLSSALVIDVSGSMAGKSNMLIAKRAALLWVNSIRLGPSECGVVSFDNATYSQQGLTVSKELLHKAINGLQPKGGTDYNAALLNKYAGLDMVSTGRNKKVIVMLTDGLGTADVATIKAKAIADNVSIYVVTLRMETPTSLQEIATATGGAYFDNIQNEQEAATAYMTILAAVTGMQTCEIEWKSAGACGPDQRNVTIQIPELGLRDSIRYFPTEESIQRVRVTPSYINFGERAIGGSYDTTINITAVNGATTITNIIGENGDYSFEPTNFTLQSGKSATIKIRFTPKTEAFSWGNFTIENSLCPANIIVTGGSITNTNDNLVVISPNGGEYFQMDKDTVIRWEGVSPTEPVMIEYSNDAGQTWTLLTGYGIGGEYKWMGIKGPKSKICLIRISQYSDRKQRKSHVFEQHQDWVIRVNWNFEGSKIASVGMDNFAMLSDVYTGETKKLLGHQFQVYDASWSPNSEKIATTGYDKTLRIWDTKTGQELEKYTNFTTDDPTVKVDPRLVAWNPKRNILLVLTTQNILQRVNFDDGSIKRMAFTSGGGVFKWSRDGQYFYIANVDNSDNKLYIKIYDDANFQLVNTIINDDGRYTQSEWTDDNTIRVGKSSYTSYTYEVYEPFTGNQIRRWVVPGNYDVIGAVSNDERYVAYRQLFANGFGFHNYVKEIATEKIVYSSITKDATRHIQWTADSKVVAFGDMDGKVKVFSLEYTPFQQDTSDSLFEVSPALVEAVPVVDLGRVVVNTQKDYPTMSVMWGTTPLFARIDSIWLDNPWEVISMHHQYKFPIYVNENEPINLEFRFAPTVDIPYGATLKFLGKEKIYLSNGGIAVNNIYDVPVRGQGVRDRLQLATKNIDFGTIELGTTKDLTNEYVLYNNGSRALVLTGVELEDPNAESFEVLTNNFPITIPGYSQYRMDIRYKPVRSGAVSSRLKFLADDPSAPAYLDVIGNATSPGEVLLYTESHEGFPGSTHEIPVKIAGRVRDQIYFTQTIGMDFGYNPTVLAPIGNQGTVYDDTTSLLSMTNIPFKIGTIGTHTLKAGLGNREHSLLNLKNITMPAGIEYYTSFGTFSLLGLCKEGGTRLLHIEPSQLEGALFATVHGTQLEVITETNERGQWTIELYSIQGQKLRTISKEISSERYIQTEFDITDLASGGYVLVATSPTMQKSHPITIVR
jgi:WD40 repeat protein/uncharacterized protein YegL